MDGGQGHHWNFWPHIPFFVDLLAGIRHVCPTGGPNKWGQEVMTSNDDEETVRHQAPAS